MLIPHAFKFFADVCNADATFFGLTAWYKYLVKADRMVTHNDPATGIISCDFAGGFQWKDGDLGLIGLGLLEICLRLAGMVAVAFVIYGGVSYITSQGQPDKTKEAQTTIINALVGAVIAIIATAVVAFIGNKLG